MAEPVKAESELQEKIRQHEEHLLTATWWVVIGYADRVEVMDGNDYRENPPDGWIWAKKVDKEKSNCPNKATAIYQATLGQIPADAIRRVFIRMLESSDFRLNDLEDISEDEAKAIDWLLVQCGEESVFSDAND